jgi:hypothetical protein
MGELLYYALVNTSPDHQYEAVFGSDGSLVELVESQCGKGYGLKTHGTTFKYLGVELVKLEIPEAVSSAFSNYLTSPSIREPYGESNAHRKLEETVEESAVRIFIQPIVDYAIKNSNL